MSRNKPSFKISWILTAVLTLGVIQTSAASRHLSGGSVYIAPQGGFETYLAAAMTKKHVQIPVTTDPDQAQFILQSVEEAKPETTGGKVVRCLFAYCAGIEGTSSASVELVDRASKDVVWAYQVHKYGAANHQSKAEAIAKHLKAWLDKQD
jgi:hypothetical protein